MTSPKQELHRYFSRQGIRYVSYRALPSWICTVSVVDPVTNQPLTFSSDTFRKKQGAEQHAALKALKHFRSVLPACIDDNDNQKVPPWWVNHSSLNDNKDSRSRMMQFFGGVRTISFCWCAREV